MIENKGNEPDHAPLGTGKRRKNESWERKKNVGERKARKKKLKASEGGLKETRRE